MTITFPAGITRVPILVDTLDDDTAEQPEEFRASLSNPSTGLVLAPIGTMATVNIMDDDGTEV